MARMPRKTQPVDEPDPVEQDYAWALAEFNRTQGDPNATKQERQVAWNWLRWFESMRPEAAPKGKGKR